MAQTKNPFAIRTYRNIFNPSKNRAPDLFSPGIKHQSRAGKLTKNALLKKTISSNEIGDNEISNVHFVSSVEATIKEAEWEEELIADMEITEDFIAGLHNIILFNAYFEHSQTQVTFLITAQKTGGSEDAITGSGRQFEQDPNTMHCAIPVTIVVVWEPSTSGEYTIRAKWYGNAPNTEHAIHGRYLEVVELKK